MASTLWIDPYETLGVARDAQLPKIHFIYRVRLYSHIRRLYKNPTTKANPHREFKRVHEAYEVLIRKNELRSSIEAIVGGELQQFKECLKILLQTRKPMSEEIQQDKNAIDRLNRERWSTVCKNSTQSGDFLDRLQPGWLIGLVSCIQLFFDFISLLLTSMKQTRFRRSHPKHKYKQREPSTTLFGVTIEKDSQDVDVELPLIVAGQRFMATPDMGSNDNVMSASVVKHLKLNVGNCFSCECMSNKYKLANGRVITCKGIVWTFFSFPSEEALDLPIKFHILEPLAMSVTVGGKFLHKTRTFTTHLNRLVRSPRPYKTTLYPQRILHIEAPRRVLQCFISGTPGEANVDVGVEINLASPEFAARSGLSIEPTDQQHQFVQLADGSMATISGCFRARFNPLDKPTSKTLRTGPRMQNFYILDGLTSDVLLGRQLLLEMYVFIDQRDQTNAFFDMKRQDLHDDLNAIAWIDSWRNAYHLHPVTHQSLIDVKHSTFWSNVKMDVGTKRDRPPQVQTCLTEAEEQMRQKQELYLKKRRQAVEANKRKEFPVLESISKVRASLHE
ncbi:hypothetical protein FSHL1_007009 [Fusarium sambucinum]